MLISFLISRIESGKLKFSQLPKALKYPIYKELKSVNKKSLVDEDYKPEKSDKDII